MVNEDLRKLKIGVALLGKTVQVFYTLHVGDSETGVNWCQEGEVQLIDSIGIAVGNTFYPWGSVVKVMIR